MNAAWLGPMVMLHSDRTFECGDMSPEDCAYYTQKWHFWYIADHVYALPTVAFFMCGIGIFIIGNFVSSQLLGYRKFRGPPVWRKLIAAIRWLSYRGFHVKALRWNSAPVGILLLGLVGAIFFFCMDLIPQPYYWSTLDFGGSPPLGTRSGWMALACMPFVFATASKTNWITLLTGVSHERLQVFHRWTAYAFFLLALMHTFPFIVYHVRFHDMEMQVEMGTLFYWTGIVALIFQAWLTFMSHSTIRALGYEFFKVSHFAAVIVFVLIFFFHCDFTLSSWDYFIATAAVYVPCLIYPWARTLFEYGGTQRATLRVEDCGFTRITIPAKFDWKPGQHCFLRFRDFGIHTLSSHPFTICSLPNRNPKEKSELVFYIRHQGGFTSKLYQHALEKPDVSVGVMVDGPYGGIDLQRYYEAEHLLVIAGGSGAGWILPFIELFVRQSCLPLADNDCCCGPDEIVDIEKSQPQIDTKAPGARNFSGSGLLSLRVVLATRDTSSRIWFEQTVGDLLAKYPNARATDIRIQVSLTGEAEKHMDDPVKAGETIITSVSGASSTEEITVQNGDHRASTTIPGKEMHGRPHLPAIIHEEAERVAGAGQALSVYICGPETMQNDVRNAVAAENLEIVKGARSMSGGVYLHSEHFSWA